MTCSYQVERRSAIDFVVHELIIPTSTTSLITISYRGELRSSLLICHHGPCTYQLQNRALLNVSHIPICHRKPSTYQMKVSSSENSSTCNSHSHKPLHYQLQRSANEHISRCKSHCTALLSSLLHVILYPTNRNRPGTYQFQTRASEQPATCMSHLRKPQLSQYPLFKVRVNEPSTTLVSPSPKPQQA
jgi:hypothetical protein